MKIDIFHITESEMEIMDQIWQADKPVTLAALGGALSHKNWKNATLHTLTARLVKKGLLICVQVSGKNLYLPCFSKEDYRFVVAKMLLDRLFHGSFTKLAASLLGDMDLTKEELAALKTMVASAVLPAEEWAEIVAGERGVAEDAVSGCDEAGEAASGCGEVKNARDDGGKCDQTESDVRGMAAMEMVGHEVAMVEFSTANGLVRNLRVFRSRDLRRSCGCLGMWAAAG